MTDLFDPAGQVRAERRAEAEDANPRVAIGGNNPPPDSVIIPDDTLPEFQKRLKAFTEGFDTWEQRPELDAETAPRANDFLTGLKKLKTEAEEARKAMTAPLRAKEKSINDRWKSLGVAFEKMEIAMSRKLTAFKKKLQDEEAARQAEARRKAKALEEEAAKAAKEAALSSKPSEAIEAEQRAASLAADAAAAAKDAGAKKVQIASATGLGRNVGLRTIRKAQIEDIGRALLHFKGHEKVHALILQLADEEMRKATDKAAVVIPGIKFIEEQV